MRWDVLVEVVGWVRVGQCEAPSETAAILLGQEMETPNLDPCNLYDTLELKSNAGWPCKIEVEEA